MTANKSHVPRIEVLEEGKRVPIVSTKPLAVSSAFSGRGVVVEKFWTTKTEHYSTRKITSHVIFLCDNPPVWVRAQSDGVSFDGYCEKGSLWILPRSVIHTATWRGPHGGVLVSIRPDEFERRLEPLAMRSAVDLRPMMNLRDPQAEYLMRAISSAVEDTARKEILLGDLLITALCVRLSDISAGDGLPIQRGRGKLPAIRLRRVLDFAQSHLDKKLSLADLARIANMGLFNFAKLFKRTTGQSPYRYIQYRRIESSKKLLADPKLTVLDVSLQVGFGHANNFARCFKQLVGVSPSQFRRNRM